jgi:hypothetical protein
MHYSRKERTFRRSLLYFGGRRMNIMQIPGRPRKPTYEVGDVVEVLNRSHLIKGAIYQLKDGKLHLIGNISRQLKQEEEAFFPLEFKDAILAEDMRDIKPLMKAKEAIPAMTGTRCLQQNELVYAKDGIAKCIVGNIKAAFNNIIAVEISDNKLIAGSARLWRRLKDTAPIPTTYEKTSTVYRILNNGEYIWGEVIGFGEKGRFAIVKMETTSTVTKETTVKYYYGRLDEWNLQSVKSSQ